MENLKPCPFCGSQGVQDIEYFRDPWSGNMYYKGWVSCFRCKQVDSDCAIASTQKEAEIKAALIWNTRPEDWQPMEDAKKDGTVILAMVRPDLATYTRRADLDRWAGKLVPIKHPGLASDGFDVGWSVALPVGYGLGCDDWFSGWKPAHSLTATEGGQ